MAPQSPWKNPHAESLIGSIRRDCLNRMRQSNYRVDRGGGWDYRLRAAQAEGVSSASR